MSTLRRCGLCICTVLAVSGAAFAAAPGPAWERATLYRDEWGTPHVYADDFHSLAFAFGWAQAEDHLEPMLVAYRIAQGRGSEIFGEAYAQSDEFALKLGHGMLARSAWPNLDGLTQDLCSGFAMGVNAWIVEHPDQTPAWADGVKPEDILALLHCYLMSFAPFDMPEAFRRAVPATTGNAWALGPTRSATGVPLLAINPHGYYDGPFRWYEAHLVCQGMNVSGATLFGLPVILQGHNAVLGWGLTPNQPDFADIFIEEPFRLNDPKSDPKSLMSLNTRADDEQVLQMMLLANARTYFVSTPEGPVERAVSCLDTPHGPIMGAERGRMLSYQVGGYRDFGTIAQLVAMGGAQDLGAFQAALGMHQLPCFHVVYADSGGNIFYLYNAKMGDKPSVQVPAQIEEETLPPITINWNAPMPISRFSWGDIIPVGTLPSVLNPTSGYVQACGNPPWGATEGSGITPGALPAWFSLDKDTARAQRVRRMLGIGQRSMSDCQSMLYDTVAPLAVELAPKLVAAAEARPAVVANAHPDTALGIGMLKDWNYTADPSSTAMTFFHAWWAALQTQDLAAAVPGKDFYQALKEGTEAAQDVALNAAADAARLMRNEFNSLTVPWGDVHTLTRGEKEIPVAGATTGEPVFVVGDFIYDSKKWRATYGYAYAMVVSFGEKPEAMSVLPFGTSEKPASSHFSDQLSLMTQGRLKAAWFLDEDVQRNASSALGRVVYLRPQGMEALFALQGPAPIEARLNTLMEAPSELPAGLAAFTLFVKPEAVTGSGDFEAHMEIRIPEVLCASADLEELAVYAHDAAGWTRVEPQEVNVEARTLSAYQPQGGRTYCVLGPARLRAERLPIPGETDVAATGPITPKVETTAPGADNAPAGEGAAPEDQSQRKWWWGLPPQPVKPEVTERPAVDGLPKKEKDTLESEFPELFEAKPPVIPPQAVDAAKAAGGSGAKVRRNFNVQLPGSGRPSTKIDVRSNQTDVEREVKKLNKKMKKQEQEKKTKQEEWTEVSP